MRMIPSTVSSETRSDAERSVFAMLSEITVSGAVGFHSLSISKHEYKRWGEIDFVVLSPRGLIALEVKGGGVSCIDGIWTYTDRFDVAHRTSEGPFRQAQTGLMALRRRLEDRLGPSVNALAFGYGVVLPQTRFDVSSVEWPDEAVIDQPHLRGSADLGRWLRHLTDYWRDRTHTRDEVPEELVREVRDLLRPEFERVPSLAYRVDAVVSVMDRLTDDQYRQLDLIESNPRILVNGGAGTGKTFLAIEIAKRAAVRGQRVLATTWSPVLAAYLRSRLPSSVDVIPFERLARADVTEKWDLLVVDEAQDLLTLDELATLDTQLLGGLELGHWSFFFDGNNQSGVRGHFDPDALEYLSTLGPMTGQLRWNCRNTREIVTQTRLLTAADLGTSSAGAGPAVEFRYYNDAADCAGLLAEHLSMLAAADVSTGDITILSPFALGDSSVSRLPSKWRNRIIEVGPENVADMPLPGLAFATIEIFKGLENKFVCLVDIGALDQSPRDMSLIYVGMSRARAGLWIAMDKGLEKAVAAAAKANVATFLAEQQAQP